MHGKLIDRLLACVPFLAVWGPAAVLALYLKQVMLENGGYMIIGRTLGRIRAPGTPFGDVFTLPEKLSLFRDDLLVALVIVPGLCLAALFLSRERLRAPLMVVFTLAVLTLMYVELTAFKSVGAFLSFESLRDAAEWGLSHPEEGTAYLTPTSLLKVLLLAASALATAVLCGRLFSSIRRSRRWSTPAVTVAIGLTALLAASWMANLPSTPYHASALGSCLRAFWAGGGVEGEELRPKPWAVLVSEYRHLTGAPGLDRTGPLWGSAAGFDVILIIFETLPARSLDVSGGLEESPSFRRMAGRSWLGLHHYSTFCWTSSAIFSIVSSWYPSSLTLNPRVARGEVPGLARSLRALGYETNVYLPEGGARRRDLPMYQDLGLEMVVVPPPRAAPETRDGDPATLWDRTVAHDRVTLQHLKADVAAFIEEGRRYAVIFQPLTGHQLGMEDLVARAPATVLEMDAFTGEILALLEREGRLDETIVIATGDHGFRTRHEDPRLQGGMLHDTAYHVPLVIYAPGLLRAAQPIPWITSHIDITPTILHLMGVEAGREREQGAPVWDQRLRDRVTFFWGAPYLGADGYHETGRFFMWQQVSDATFASDRMQFADGSPQSRESAAHHDVIRKLVRMRTLQQAWLRKDAASATD